MGNWCSCCDRKKKEKKAIGVVKGEEIEALLGGSVQNESCSCGGCPGSIPGGFILCVDTSSCSHLSIYSEDGNWGG